MSARFNSANVVSNILPLSTASGDGTPVRGLHLNVVIDKINEIIDEQKLTSVPYLDKITIHDNDYKTSIDSQPLRFSSLKKTITELNALIVAYGLSVEPVSVHIINNRDYKTPNEAFETKVLHLNRIIDKFNTIVSSGIEQYYNDFDIAYHFKKIHSESSGGLISTITDINGNNALVPHSSSKAPNLTDERYLSLYDEQSMVGDVADMGNFDLGTNDLYMLFYGKFPKVYKGNGTQFMFMHSGGASGPDSGYTLYTISHNTADPLFFFIFSDGVTHAYSYGPIKTLFDDQFHYLEVVCDRDVGTTLYIDGVALVNTGDGTVAKDGDNITCAHQLAINGTYVAYNKNGDTLLRFFGIRKSLPTTAERNNYKSQLTNDLIAWEKLPNVIGTNGKTGYYFEGIAGQTPTIYGDQLCSVPIDNDLKIDYTIDSTIMTVDGNNATQLASFGGGTPYYTWVVKNGTKELHSRYNRHYIRANGDAATTKTIMMIADSLGSGIPTQLGVIRSVFPLSTWTGIGTIGVAPDLCESHSGKTYDWLINHADSPFTKAGVLDIPAYFTDNGLADPDFIHMRMGVNEAAGHSGNEMTRDELFQWISDIKELCTAFLTHNAAIKIIVGMPTSSENTGAGWQANYGPGSTTQDNYLSVIFTMRRAIEMSFSANFFNVNVVVGRETLYLDRDSGYPKVNGVHSNGVHPTIAGYEQLGLGQALDLNALL